MMTRAQIIQEVEDLKEDFDETDPFRLAEDLDICLCPYSMGTTPGAVKGCALFLRQIPFIIFNDEMPRTYQRLIVAHELCHIVFHFTKAGQVFHDTGLLDENNVLDREANYFAAELVISDDDVMDCCRDGLTFYQCAALLEVPPEMLALKYFLMQEKGYKLRDPPVIPSNDFLKNMEVPEVDEFWWR